MEFDEIVRVLDALDRAAVRHWVAGGWGVAALVGEQTREHRDLDLLVDAEDLDRCLAVLTDLGYRRETDWLPVRVEYVAEGLGWVDVHPVAFSEDGVGRQASLDGEPYLYCPSMWTEALLGGRRFPCLTVQQQQAFHAGYAPRPQDMHDLDQLARLTAREQARNGSGEAL